MGKVHRPTFQQVLKVPLTIRQIMRLDHLNVTHVALKRSGIPTQLAPPRTAIPIDTETNHFTLSVAVAVCQVRSLLGLADEIDLSFSFFTPFFLNFRFRSAADHSVFASVYQFSSSSNIASRVNLLSSTLRIDFP